MTIDLHKVFWPFSPKHPMCRGAFRPFCCQSALPDPISYAARRNSSEMELSFASVVLPAMTVLGMPINSTTHFASLDPISGPSDLVWRRGFTRRRVPYVTLIALTLANHTKCGGPGRYCPSVTSASSMASSLTRRTLVQCICHCQ